MSGKDSLNKHQRYMPPADWNDLNYACTKEKLGTGQTTGGERELKDELLEFWRRGGRNGDSCTSLDTRNGSPVGVSPAELHRGCRI